MTKAETLIIKLALLADWQYLCHDDFDEETEMDEDQYWQYLESKSTDEINKMIEEDFDAERTPEFVLNLYLTYLSPKYQEMMESPQ